MDIKKSQYAEQGRRQQATADKAYEIQTNIMQQQVIAQQVKIEQTEKAQVKGCRRPRFCAGKRN